MLKVKVVQYIWIIGVPRSGTTFLTDYLCQYANSCYNEPWGEYDLKRPAAWKFPQENTTVFKYCANWQNAKLLNEQFKKSYFVHLIRHPRQVVHSMVYPKANAFPFRNLFDTSNTYERFHLAVAKWREFFIGSRAACRKYHSIEIVYDRLPQEIDRLQKFLNLPLHLHNLKFKHKQADESDLEHLWHMPQHKTYLTLRSQIEEEFFSKSLKLS